MSYIMFGVGFVIFAVYLVFLFWNIVYNGNKQQEENYDLGTKSRKLYKNRKLLWITL